MRDLLIIIRGLAVGWVALSIPAVPLGLVALNSGLRADVGDNALGDLIALGLGIALLVFGAGGLILGTGLAVLAKRAGAAPAEIRYLARPAFRADSAATPGAPRRRLRRAGHGRGRDHG